MATTSGFVLRLDRCIPLLRRAHQTNTTIGVGTTVGRPSLRTGLADFPHPALQLGVSFQEDWQAAAWACFKEYKPAAVK